MEDLKEFEIMRTALLNHKIFPEFADHITTYMVNILLPTTDIAMDHKEKKKLVKQYINPDLCHITEQLVYTDSLTNFSDKNYVIEPLQEFVEKEIYEDQQLRLEGSKMKFDFMNHAQALIHGDLHAGSIFVTENRTKVFDPEFAFYGPMGYDVGNVIAHFFIPSGSALSVTMMPLLSPLGEVLNISQQTTVLAMQIGATIPNIIFPTIGATIAMCGLAHVPFAKWVRFAVKMVLAVYVVCIVFILIAVKMNYGPF